MSERNKFSFGDVTGEVGEILDGAKSHIELALGGLRKVIGQPVNIAKDFTGDTKKRVENAAEDLTKRAANGIEISRSLSQTLLGKLISTEELGDRPNKDEV